jgi:hypothetical protein
MLTGLERFSGIQIFALGDYHIVEPSQAIKFHKKPKKDRHSNSLPRQNRFRQRSLLPILSTDTRWAALEALRRDVANKTPLGDAQLPWKNGV